MTERQFFRDLRDLYDLRSSVAHKGQIKTKDGADRKKKDALLNRGINIASSTVIALMKNGWPNWNELILGSDQIIGE